MILEDDVLFHRDTLARLAATVRSLPPDWAVLQLGAMQLHWEESWITWHGADLYRCNGSSFGAHAVALRREVLPDLLERCRRRDLPFDTGALQEIKRTYRQRCFTCFPNLAIQDARDSEIGMSRLSAAEIMRPATSIAGTIPTTASRRSWVTTGRLQACARGRAWRRRAGPSVARSAAIPPRHPSRRPNRCRRDRRKGRRGSAWRRWANWVRAAPARSSWPSWSAQRRTSMRVPWRCSVVS